MAFTKIIVSLELINGGSLQLASAPTWILLQGNPCPKSNPTLLCNWYKNQIPVLPGEPSFLNDWSTGKHHGVCRQHLWKSFTRSPHCSSVSHGQTEVRVLWGEFFFFCILKCLRDFTTPRGKEYTSLSLSHFPLTL